MDSGCICCRTADKYGSIVWQHAYQIQVSHHTPSKKSTTTQAVTYLAMAMAALRPPSSSTRPLSSACRPVHTLPFATLRTCPGQTTIDHAHVVDNNCLSLLCTNTTSHDLRSPQRPLSWWQALRTGSRHPEGKVRNGTNAVSRAHKRPVGNYGHLIG